MENYKDVFEPCVFTQEEVGERIEWKTNRIWFEEVRYPFWNLKRDGLWPTMECLTLDIHQQAFQVIM